MLEQKSHSLSLNNYVIEFNYTQRHQKKNKTTIINYSQGEVSKLRKMPDKNVSDMFMSREGQNSENGRKHNRMLRFKT